MLNKKYKEIGIIGLCLSLFVVGYSTNENLELDKNLLKKQSNESIIRTDYFIYDTASELIDSAEVIVKGKVIEPKTITSTELPYTIFNVEIESTYKGNIKNKDVIQVKQLGGVVDGVKYKDSNGADLKINEEYVLLLQGHSNDDPYSMLNPIQGSYNFDDENNKLVKNENNTIELNHNQLKQLS